MILGLPTPSNDDAVGGMENNNVMSVIRIRLSQNHAAITVPGRQIEPSYDVKLHLIAWLVSDLGRELGVEEIELAYELEDGANRAM